MKYYLWAVCTLVVISSAACEHADPISADNGENEATLSSIQADIFSNNCAISGCHDGTGSSLPGSMNLRAENAFSNIVGVSSVEKPALNRVEPGDPDNSYLVRKLEGGPDINGSRMPFGRPPLSQSQIDRIREWIDKGALNN